jgi:hypothetical protein
MTIHPLGAELLYADGLTDGQTDMTRLIVVFRNFTNAPNNKNYRKTAGVSDNSRFPDRHQYHIFFKRSFPLSMPKAGPLRSSTMPITSPTLPQTLNRIHEHNHTLYHRCKGKAEVIMTCATTAHGEVMI